jgi:diaminohydroxyphosphoribosylaminopyrimidine deaminase/5-amino-6-(5-phosphoribosylamino)uracil reductase
MFSAADYGFMARALHLAEKGLNSTSPNPRVGCVIVQAGEIVGEGWHQRAGEPHAEVHALGQAGERAQGATVYVTLEPCSHFGRTPPCADALIAAQVGRVVVAMQDPNPAVAGAGLARLRAAGIDVPCGLLEAEAKLLNIGFVSRMTRGRPWLRIKTASTLDGRTALADGKSYWITSEEARRDVHRIRARSCAIVTGIGTVLADDPRLDVRGIETTRQPLRVVVDSQLRLPPQARLLNTGRVLVATTAGDPSRIAALEDAGAEVLVLGEGGRVDLAKLFQELARREINEVMTEAGRTLNGALIASGLADEWVMYTAPVLFGNSGLGLFDLPVVTEMKDRQELAIQDARMVGRDLRITARFV